MQVWLDGNVTSGYSAHLILISIQKKVRIGNRAAIGAVDRRHAPSGREAVLSSKKVREVVHGSGKGSCVRYRRFVDEFV